MVTIYLARHGQNEDNAKGILNGHRDEPLTELGVEQARQTARLIADSKRNFDAIYSSPLQRAHVTAEIIAQELGGLKPVVLDSLIERNFGVMTGKSVSQIVELCSPDILKTDTGTYFLSPTGAETFPDLIERGKAVIEYIKQMHTDGSVLLVTHGDIGKMIYAAYYDLDWKEVLAQFHFGNGELLELSQGSPTHTSCS